MGGLLVLGKPLIFQIGIADNKIKGLISIAANQRGQVGPQHHMMGHLTLMLKSRAGHELGQNTKFSGIAGASHWAAVKNHHIGVGQLAYFGGQRRLVNNTEFWGQIGVKGLAPPAHAHNMGQRAGFIGRQGILQPAKHLGRPITGCIGVHLVSAVYGIANHNTDDAIGETQGFHLNFNQLAGIGNFQGQRQIFIALAGQAGGKLARPGRHTQRVHAAGISDQFVLLAANFNFNFYLVQRLPGVLVRHADQADHTGIGNGGVKQ